MSSSPKILESTCTWAAIKTKTKTHKDEIKKKAEIHLWVPVTVRLIHSCLSLLTPVVWQVACHHIGWCHGFNCHLCGHIVAYLCYFAENHNNVCPNLGINPMVIDSVLLVRASLFRWVLFLFWLVLIFGLFVVDHDSLEFFTADIHIMAAFKRTLVVWTCLSEDL